MYLCLFLVFEAMFAVLCHFNVRAIQVSIIEMELTFMLKWKIARI